MQSKRYTKTSVIAITIFLLIIGILIPLASAQPVEDPGDGVWTDSFKDKDSVECQDCTVDEDNGTITLNRKLGSRTYDFAEKDFAHEAYEYTSFLPLWYIFPPTYNTGSDTVFDPPDYNDIKIPDEDYVERSSGFLERFIVHRFSFQVDVDEDTIGDIDINWHGKFENTDKKLRMYLWRDREYLANLQYWAEIKNSDTSGEDIVLKATIEEDIAKLAVTDNYIDIVLVAQAQYFGIKTCTLYTDYVNITSRAEKVYDAGPGYATTKDPIEPRDISDIKENETFYWDILTWDDYQSQGAQVKYQILHPSEGDYELVEDKYFSDGKNSEGFTTPPVHLNLIPTRETDAYDSLKIRANLTTSTPPVTPRIYSWAITWQKDDGRWQDLFNSTYRVDDRNQTSIEGGLVNISPIIGEWPLFGFNAQNTRATDGDGPSEANLYWYSQEEDQVGSGFRNPVIGDGFIYIANQERKVYR
jgi:hypothetical protein